MLKERQAVVFLALMVLVLIGVPGAFKPYFQKAKGDAYQIQAKWQGESFLAVDTKTQLKDELVFGLQTSTEAEGKINSYIDFVGLQEIAKSKAIFTGQIVRDVKRRPYKLLYLMTGKKAKKIPLALVANDGALLRIKVPAKFNPDKILRNNDATLVVKNLTVIGAGDCYNKLKTNKSSALCNLDLGLPYQIEYFQEPNGLHIHIIPTKQNSWQSLGIYDLALELPYAYAGKGKRENSEILIRRQPAKLINFSNLELLKPLGVITEVLVPAITENEDANANDDSSSSDNSTTETTSSEIETTTELSSETTTEWSYSETETSTTEIFTTYTDIDNYCGDQNRDPGEECELDSDCQRERYCADNCICKFGSPDRAEPADCLVEEEASNYPKRPCNSHSDCLPISEDFKCDSNCKCVLEGGVA